MAHVLVAHADRGIRDAVGEVLREEAGHAVMGTANGILALAALWVSARPMVVLVDDRLSLLSGMSVLDLAAIDEVWGPLSRHRYILLTTSPDHIDAKGRTLLSRLDAPVLPLPFELGALIRVVNEAAETIPDEPRHLSPLQLVSRGTKPASRAGGQAPYRFNEREGREAAMRRELERLFLSTD